jgi:ABC-2 type transport system permease protein
VTGAPVLDRPSPVTRLLHRVVRAPHLRWTLGLIGLLALKNFRTRYKRSFLGVLWVVVQPTLQAVILSFVVVRVFHAQTVGDYTLYVLTGTVVWGFTQVGLNSATTSVLDNASLVKKVRVAPIVYPASSVGGQLLGFLAPLAVLLLLCAVHGTLSWTALLVPAAVALHVLFLLALGLLTASLYVTYRDVAPLVTAVLSLAFYATPILYDVHQLPSWAQDVVRANPMTGVLSLYRAVFLGRGVDTPALVLSLVVSALLLALSLSVFRRRAGEFADLV